MTTGINLQGEGKAVPGLQLGTLRAKFPFAHARIPAFQAQFAAGTVQPIRDMADCCKDNNLPVLLMFKWVDAQGNPNVPNESCVDDAEKLIEYVQGRGAVIEAVQLDNENLELNWSDPVYQKIMRRLGRRITRMGIVAVSGAMHGFFGGTEANQNAKFADRCFRMKDAFCSAFSECAVVGVQPYNATDVGRAYWESAETFLNATGGHLRDIAGGRPMHQTEQGTTNERGRFATHRDRLTGIRDSILTYERFGFARTYWYSAWDNYPTEAKAFGFMERATGALLI